MVQAFLQRISGLSAWAVQKIQHKQTLMQLSLIISLKALKNEHFGISFPVSFGDMCKDCTVWCHKCYEKRNLCN